MTYVDGFVMPIPKKNLAAYKKMAAQLAEEAFLIFVANAPILIGTSEKTANNPTVVYRYGEDSINLRGLTPND